MISLEMELLPWDSNWLGFPVARFVAGLGDDTAGVARAIAECRATGVCLLYLALEPAAAQAASVARAAGAWLVDAKLTYEMALTELSEFPLSLSGISSADTARMAPAKAFTSPLQDLARASGEHSRFRRDARIGWAAYCVLYDQWLGRLLALHLVWESTVAGTTAGLLAMDGQATTASIELLAVAPMARRQHIGQGLVHLAQQEAQRQGYQKLRVVTQGSNLPAQRLYERCGFLLRHTSHWYHLWL